MNASMPLNFVCGSDQTQDFSNELGLGAEACETRLRIAPVAQLDRATAFGIIHDLSFAGVGLTLFPSMLAFGWAFRQSSGWRSLSTYTWLTAALAVPTFALKGAAFYVFLVAVLLWTAKVAWRLKKMADASKLSFPPR